MIHQSRKEHQGRDCNIKEGNVIKIENAIHQSRKCNIKIENVIKVENATSMFITQWYKNKKGQNTEVMKFNSRQLIRYLKIENAALKCIT